MSTQEWLSHAWQVLLLFIIPIGGGIPAGVVVGNEKGLGWPSLMALYFVSDVMLACAFDPVVHFLKRHPRLQNFKRAYKDVLNRTVLKPGARPGPFALVILTFGTDPMTGRLANLSLGHGFFSGWAIAIAGDMIFFVLVMASTLGLKQWIGDPTTTAVVITLVILGGPMLWRRFVSR